MEEKNSYNSNQTIDLSGSYKKRNNSGFVYDRLNQTNFDREGLTEKVIKYSGGLIKNKKQANLVLLAAVILFLIIAWMLLPDFFHSRNLEAIKRLR